MHYFSSDFVMKKKMNNLENVNDEEFLQHHFFFLRLLLQKMNAKHVFVNNNVFLWKNECKKKIAACTCFCKHFFLGVHFA
jgi:hypothetical protein